VPSAGRGLPAGIPVAPEGASSRSRLPLPVVGIGPRRFVLPDHQRGSRRPFRRRGGDGLERIHDRLRHRSDLHDHPRAGGFQLPAHRRRERRPGGAARLRLGGSAALRRVGLPVDAQAPGKNGIKSRLDPFSDPHPLGMRRDEG